MLFLMLTVCHSFGMVHAQEVRLDIDLEKANFAEFMEQVKKTDRIHFLLSRCNGDEFERYYFTHAAG